MKAMFRPAAVAASLLAALYVGAPQAAQLTLDLDGVRSYGELNDPANVRYQFKLGAGATIVSVTWDVVLTANAPSWLSELAARFDNTSGSGFARLTPGVLNDFSGTATYSDSGNLVDTGISFQTESDGLLHVQFFEHFKDSDLAWDGAWNGRIVVDYTPGVTAVPEPSSAALVALAAAGAGIVYRRRKPR